MEKSTKKKLFISLLMLFLSPFLYFLNIQNEKLVIIIIIYIFYLLRFYLIKEFNLIKYYDYDFD
jgi:hypothetical protein